MFTSQIPITTCLQSNDWIFETIFELHKQVTQRRAFYNVIKDQQTDIYQLSRWKHKIIMKYIVYLSWSIARKSLQKFTLDHNIWNLSYHVVLSTPKVGLKPRC